MNLTNSEIIGRIMAAREKRGLSQEEAAERAGVSQEYWSRIENGKQRASSLEQLSRLARGVGLRLDVHLRRLR